MLFKLPFGAVVCVGDMTTGLWLLFGAGAAFFVGLLGWAGKLMCPIGAGAKEVRKKIAIINHLKVQKAYAGARVDKGLCRTTCC